MVTNLSWKNTQRKQLKKIVYGLDPAAINKVIKAHEARGWERASEIKEHGYGLGCLMKFKIRK